MKDDKACTVQISLDGRSWVVASAFGELVRLSHYIRPNGPTLAAYKLAQRTAALFNLKFYGDSLWG